VTVLDVEAQLAGAMRRALDDAAKATTWTPLPHQIPPEGNWDGWALFGGRGVGKTDAGAEYMCRHVKGPACLSGPNPHWMAIIAPTQMDAATSCFSGPTGIRAHDASAVKVTSDEGTVVRWPNGSQAKLYGTDTEKATDSLRSGGNTCLVWAEELAAWRWLDLAWAMMELGLRSGPHPRWIATTTPKPRLLIKKIDKGQMPGVVRTHARTQDNPHLSQELRDKWFGLYGGTELGEQELEGRIVEQATNALWKREQIARFRLSIEQAPLLTLRRRLVGVDPSGGHDEQGIVVVGFSDGAYVDHAEHQPAVPRGLVLADYTCNLEPDQWGDRAIQAAIDWDADGIVFESDYGRDMPHAILVNAAKRAGIMIPIKPSLAQAIGNKRARAFPVAQLAAQGRYPHRGTFEQLEDQLCTWTEKEKNSPDRMDAMVWPAWESGLVSITLPGAASMPGVEAAGTSLALHRRR
jgi:phage terminase large subunit-like protein